MAKVGRNDPCPCGSGKKYKKCCGRTAQANALNEVARIGYKWIDMMINQTIENALQANGHTQDQSDRLNSLNWLCDTGDLSNSNLSDLDLDLELAPQELGIDAEVEVNADELEGAHEMTESGDLKADAKLSQVLKTVDIETANRRDRKLFSQLKLSLSRSTFETFEVLEVLRGSGFKVQGCFSGRIFQINQAHDAAQLEPMEWLYGRIVVFGRRAYLLQGWEKLPFRNRKSLKKDVLTHLAGEPASLIWLKTQSSWLLTSCRSYQDSTVGETSL